MPCYDRRVRDHEQVLARLSVALMVGLTGCKDDEAKSESVHVAFGDIKTSRGDDEKGEHDEGKGEQEAPGSTGAAGGSTGEVKAEVDPEQICGGADNTMTVGKAAMDRLTVDEVHDCPRTVLSTSLDVLDYSIDEDATKKLRDAGDTGHCCYTPRAPKERIPLGVGRPFMLGETSVRPKACIGPRLHAPTIEGPAGRRVAAGWIADARMEWASVASFRRAAAELAAVDAPRSLIDDCFAAADEEGEHARMCLSMASEVSGRELSLEPLPSAVARSGELPDLLRRTFAEGCVCETIAALVAARSARRASGSAARVLARIADDETGHAALAWRTVGWIWSRMDARRRGDFLQWARARQPPATGEGPGADPDAVHGRLGRATQAAIAADAWRRCIAPLLDELQSKGTERREPVATSLGYDCARA